MALLELLYEVKSGISKFMHLLREPVEEMTREAIQEIVVPLTQVLDEICLATGNAQIAEDLSAITRRTIAGCLRIVKISQQGGDLDDAQEELQDIGSEFNGVCRQFATFARDFETQYEDNYEDNYDDDISSSVVSEITNKADFQHVLSIKDRYIILNISDNSDPCIKMKPVFEQLAQSHPSALFLLINPSKTRDVPDAQGLSRLPHFRFYFNGQNVKEFSGPNENYLRTVTSQFIDPPKQTQQQQKPQQTQSQQTQSQPTSQQNTPQRPQQVYKPEPPVKAPVVDFNFLPYKGSNHGCVIEIHNKPQYDQLLSNHAKIIVVCIYINSAVCNASLYLFRELAEANGHVDFLLIDQNEMKQIPAVADAKNLPFFRFYKDGKIVKDFGGQFQEDTLRAAVNSIVVKARPKPSEKDVARTGLHTPGKVLNLTTDDMFRQLLGVPDVLIIVNFFNHEKISKDMLPAMAKAAADNLTAVFAQVDVNACKQKIRACAGVLRLPTFRFYKNGERVKEWMGKDPEYLEGLVKQFNK